MSLVSCSVGSGDGELTGSAFFPACGYAGGTNPATDGARFDAAIDSFLGEELGERMQIRLQHGTAGVAVSDGLLIEIANRHDLVRAIRDSEDGSAVLTVVAELEPLAPEDTAPVGRASLYLNSTCPDAFVDFAHGVGTVRFTSMYARTADGDPTDVDRIAGIVESLRFEDDRPEARVDGIAPWVEVTGWFDFGYMRGRPSQPFP